MAERKKEDDNNNKKKKTKQPVLGVGDVVRTAAHQYSVVKQLGQGGFGAVLEVVEQDPRRGQEPKRWAMKLEEIEIDKGAMANRLKIEVAVMKRIRDAPVEHKKHFTHMHDRCRTPDYRAIVMTLVGPSLADLLKRRRPDGFSVATALKLGLHTCEAIDDLHRLGFLHRDIKPANYATGADAHKIFLLDFGISKRYLDDRGHLRLPREAVHFLGTTRYAARTCHQSREQGRRDDLESWFYMLVEFFNPAAVFWRDTHDRNEVLRKKQKARTEERHRFFDKCPQPHLGHILDYIDTLAYEDTPDFRHIYRLLKYQMSRDGVDEKQPICWQELSSAAAPSSSH